MRVDAFDFALPEHLIALRPAEPRDSARLLRVHGGTQDLSDHLVRDLPDLLRRGDLLVVNDTRVIPAQFTARRADRTAPAQAGAEGLFGASFGVTLHTRAGPNTWRAFVKGAKKLRAGDRLTLTGGLGALVAEKGPEGDVLLAFEIEGPDLDLAIATHGTMPLPPYIARRRRADDRDRDDYQTVYAARDGSVAAPTAGLHFTPELLARLDMAGIGRTTVTLHVGPGTFLPVKTDDTAAHVMHAEWGLLSPDTAARIADTRSAGGRIVAVGTTALRLLESAVDESGHVQPFTGTTDLFITPGFQFRAADLLMTNFHLPRSTLFMLVCAFAGSETMRAAYAHAIARGYRFYSYGDSSLLSRAPA